VVAGGVRVPSDVLGILPDRIGGCACGWEQSGPQELYKSVVRKWLK